MAETLIEFLEKKNDYVQIYSNSDFHYYLKNFQKQVPSLLNLTERILIKLEREATEIEERNINMNGFDESIFNEKDSDSDVDSTKNEFDNFFLSLLCTSQRKETLPILANPNKNENHFSPT